MFDKQKKKSRDIEQLTKQEFLSGLKLLNLGVPDRILDSLAESFSGRDIKTGAQLSFSLANTVKDRRYIAGIENITRLLTHQYYKVEKAVVDEDKIKKQIRSTFHSNICLTARPQTDKQRHRPRLR